VNALPFPLPSQSGSIPVVKTCACPPLRRPERTRAHVFRMLRQFVMAFDIPDEEPLFSVKCRTSGKVMVISAGDVRAV